MKQWQDLLDRHHETLKFLRSGFPLYHRSNLFFRDVQYGIQTLLRERGASVSYGEAEGIARALIGTFEREKMLVPIDRQTWVLDYPEFKKPSVKPAAPASPAAGGGQAARVQPSPSPGPTSGQ